MFFSKIIGFVKKYYLIILGLAWFAFLYVPSFGLKYSLLDDGFNFRNARIITQSFADFDFKKIFGVVLEPDQGRVRPAYWFMESFLYGGGFASPEMAHFARIMLLLITLGLLYFLLKKFNIDVLWIVFSLFIFATSIQTFENYYRVGPAESWLILVYSVTLILIFRKRIGKFDIPVIVFLALVGAFTKETYFISGIPFFLVGLFMLLLRKKEIKWVAIKCLFFALALGLFQIMILLIKSNYVTQVQVQYASNYDLMNIGRLLRNFRAYQKSTFFFHFPLFHISMGYLVYFLWKAIKGFKKLESEDFFFLILWLSVFAQQAILAPWAHVLGRYMLLVNVNLVLIYAITFMKIFNLFYPRIIKFIPGFAHFRLQLGVFSALALLPIFFVRNIFPIANFQLQMDVESKLSFEGVSALNRHIPKGETVFVNFKENDNNIEVFLENGWHLEEFYKRYDVRFDYLKDNNLCTLEPRFIFDRTSDRFLDKIVFDDNDKFELIEKGEATYEPINYGVVVKSFFYRQKLEGWSTKYGFDWAIYKQKGGTCVK